MKGEREGRQGDFKGIEGEERRGVRGKWEERREVQGRREGEGEGYSLFCLLDKDLQK